jgi:ribosomal protein S18 acetylase RimI-like enzyme
MGQPLQGASWLQRSDFLVRSAQVQDIAGMARVLVQGFDLVPYGWMRPIAEAGIQADLQARLGRKNLYQAFVALRSDLAQVVGTVEVTVQKSGLGWMPPYPYLASLTVAKDYRGLGIARQLIKACENQVFLWNRDDLYLHVLSDNIAARRLYLSLDYRMQGPETLVFNPSRWVLENRIFLHRRLLPRSRLDSDF